MNVGRELVRQVWRSWRHHPWFTACAVVALAVALGGTTLLLSLYDAIAFRPLAVAQPQELVSIRLVDQDTQGRALDLGRVSLAEFEALREGAGGLADLAAYAVGEAVVRVGERSEHATVEWIDERHLEVLGVRPRLGRFFAPDDDPVHGGTGGAILSEAAWIRLTGGEPRLAGLTVVLDGVAIPVLGVAPRQFHGFDVGVEPALFALASQMPPDQASFRLCGRLHSGVGAEQLEGQLAGVLAGLRAAQPSRQTFLVADGQSSRAEQERLEVVDGRRGESTLRGAAAQSLALVAALLGLVLVVLAANLANLLAVRSLTESGATAVRMALGAPRSVVVGGWFAESLALALAGSGLGLAAVARAGPVLLGWTPLPPWVEGLSLEVGARSVLVAFGLALLVAALVGSLSAWEQWRVTPALRLRQEGPSTTRSRVAIRWRNGLIAAQVSLSAVLLVATGLFVRSAAALLGIDTGFPLERILTFQVDLPPTIDRPAAALRELGDELGRLPGVVDAGLSTDPILGGARSFVLAAIEGYTPRPEEVLMLNNLAVSPGYFAAVSLRPASGRALTPGDDGTVVNGVVINQRFAETYFPGREPLGRRISFDYQRTDWSSPSADDLTVVGVVEDRLTSDVREAPTPRLYTLPDPASGSAQFYVRSVEDPRRLASAIERLIRARTPQAALGSMRTLAEQRDLSLRQELLTRDLALVFGAFATTLAALGLFAILSYTVSERRRELGLRQALGATPRDLLRRVLADGLRPMFGGLVVGLLASAALARLAASFLFGVTPRDPLAFVGALAILAVVGVVAALPPALAAARIDPTRALRDA